MNFLPYVWIGLMIILAVVEFSTSNLVTIWFVVGALATAVVSFFVPSFAVQLIVFVLVSFISLIATRPLMKKIKKTKFEPTNADRNIGKIAVVTQEINNVAGTGQVKLGGEIWTARTVDGEVVPEGTQVTVEKISGVKLMVSAMSTRQKTTV